MSIGQSPANLNVTKYTGDQFSDVPCVNTTRAPTTSDINYPLFTLWRNGNKQAVAPDAEGDMWYLARFQPNGALSPLAIWTKVASATNGNIEQIVVDSGTSPVYPVLDSVTMTGTGISGSGIKTVGSSGTVSIEMNSPFNLSSFSFPMGVYSFVNANFLSNAGLTQTVTTITDGSQWIFVASTNNITADGNFTAVAAFLGTGAAATFVVQPIATSQISFANSANNVEITNVSGASRHLVVTGIRLF